MNKIILILIALLIGASSQVAPVKVDATFTIQFEGMTLEKLAQMEKHLMEICKDAKSFNMTIPDHPPAPGKINDLEWHLYPIFESGDTDTSLDYWTPIICDTINWYMPFAKDTTIPMDEHSIKAEIWLQK